LVLTGIRQGEALGLRWQDVDVKRAVIRVRHQMGREGALVEPKTRAAKRDVPFPPSLGRMLAAHRLALGHSADGDYVFCSETGGPLHPRNIVRRGLEKAITAARLPHLTWHDLRYLAASVLIAEGTNVTYLSRMLGHPSPAITLSIYAHEFARAEHDDRTREMMEAMYGGDARPMSSGWPDADFESDLRRLLRHARRMSSKGIKVDPEVQREQVVRINENGTLVVVEGDGVRLLRALQRRLAGPSRAVSGSSGEETRALLLRACEQAVEGTIKTAIEALRATLAEPVQEWVITEPIDMILPVPRLTVGHTTYSNSIPREAARLQYAIDRGFAAPVRITRVSTRGFTTARILARQRFAESLAILDLATPPANVGSEMTAWRAGDGGSVSFVRQGPILTDQVISGTRLVSPYRQLARAVGRQENARADWERRLIAATRWFSRSYRSEWPADRLASAMVALECVFIADRSEQTKGSRIAERMTDRFKLNEQTRDQQLEWLLHLYRARNDAIHEGRDFLNDLEVDRLLDLTRYALIGFALHLDPSHRPRHRSCRTYDEAMRCSAPAP